MTRETWKITYEGSKGVYEMSCGPSMYFIWNITNAGDLAASTHDAENDGEVSMVIIKRGSWDKIQTYTRARSA